MRWFSRAMVTATVLVASSVCEADQAAWIAKKDADAAAAMIHVGDEVRGYCAPCGDTVYEPVKVKSVAVAKPDPKQSYYEVRINGTGIDLAYEYILVNGHWVNLAMQVGVQVVDVPDELPASLPRKK